MSNYALLLKGRRRSFLEGTRRGATLRLPPRALGCHKRWKVSPFAKLEITLALLCFVLDSLTNKHCRTWSSMINLWIDSCCQWGKGLIITWSFQKKMFWGILCCHIDYAVTLNFAQNFLIWFQKILKLIFQRPSSCPRKICTDYWRKLPTLTAFLEIFWYPKNNDSVEHVSKVLLIVLFIYF